MARWAARTLRRAFFTLILLTTIAQFLPALTLTAGILELQKDGSGYALGMEGIGRFYATTYDIQNARLIQVPNTTMRVILWEEKRTEGPSTPFFAISLDGQRIVRVQQAAYDLLLRYAQFDPLMNSSSVDALLAAREPANESTFIVQFVTQPLEEYRQQIETLGGTLYKYLANYAYVVRMNPAAKEQVSNLPFVRWVGPYHPAYRLEESLIAELTQDGDSLPASRYSIQVFERGKAQQDRVAMRIEAMGGTINKISPQGFRLEATVTRDALLEVAHMDEVQFIDRWTAPEPDVTTAREIGGADFLESVAGFTGTGVRGEVMDAGIRATHQDFQSRPIIIHGANPGVDSHGTSTTGIIFGDGRADMRGRGFLPTGQGIFASYLRLSNRYQHTAELLEPPYQALFQSNSWGGGLTRQYTTVSADMDDILFNNDIIIAQSQSNAGNQMSRPEAWAKNIVSVGGILHRGTVTMDDDCWCSRGSIGPAADGRIKPDLAHFYDMNFTPSGRSDTSYTPSFGGTSAATPIVAGHFGLFFEMWHNQIFGNPGGETVFDSRPHMATAKAMIINTAKQWTFTGPQHDLTRVHQGWGLPDLANLYNLRDKIFVVDQTDILLPFETRTYRFQSQGGGTPLRATLVYSDPSGTTSSTQHRINKLNLKVTSPTAVVYWGNNGLMSGLWSTPAGDPDTKNTTENVFINSPDNGTWTFEVIAAEINEDSHLETPEIDADYALVISGIVPSPAGRR
ncbi:MAG: S8 family serine peptidase [Acidobacteria bacterium]|nr:S8 family serine peptidase [Acidobacteriota bacterium]MBI3658430.1 S8 family serine peptidase [Acidobacteriota bacterium]